MIWRITEPSTIEPVSSTSMCRSRKAAAKWPLRAQFENRLYTLFQGPKRSGKSRQGRPVFALYRTASMKSRSPRVACGPVFCGGRTRCRRAHCLSVSACRCTPAFDHILLGAAKKLAVSATCASSARGRPGALPTGRAQALREPCERMPAGARGSHGRAQRGR